MQSILFIISFFVFLVFILSNLNTSFSVSDNNSYLTYLNHKLNFSIQYPDSWKLTENFQQLDNVSYHNIEIASPFEGTSDLLQERFLISINKLEKNITFYDYVRGALNQFNSTYKDFELLTNTLHNTSVPNVAKISYSYVAGEGPLSIKLIMTHKIISNTDKVYVLSLATSPNDYYQFLPIIQTIFDSFRFL